ncbi:MAG: hypothetical protein K0S47_4717, partial [Herbinix sp.]|nr:hypothetical protein [Herbinix sp.]
FDGEVILEDIDKDFFESIEEFKQGFITMYPELSFKGRVTPTKVTDNRQEESYQTATFFSGGVDAYNTLITHIEENPILVTLWGADISFEDQAGWNLVDHYIGSIASNNKLDYISIKTSFRRFLNEGALSEYVILRTGNNWWYGFQHGIGIIGHAAPAAYQAKIKTVYIASSLTREDNSTCASDPSIDNFVKFCSSQVIHDGFEYSRQDKVNRICEYAIKAKTPVQLRVCWESEGGSNCCHCEKCHLTILCLLAGKNDPREYGFHYADGELAGMMKDFRREIHFSHPSCIVLYKIIQAELRKNYTISQVDPSLRWYYKTDLEKDLSFQKRLLYRIIRKVEKIYRK